MQPFLNVITLYTYTFFTTLTPRLHGRSKRFFRRPQNLNAPRKIRERLWEGTKQTVGILRFNFRRSQVRKKGKIVLNQSLIHTYIHPFPTALTPIIFIFPSSSQKQKKKFLGRKILGGERLPPLAPLQDTPTHMRKTLLQSYCCCSSLDIYM